MGRLEQGEKHEVKNLFSISALVTGESAVVDPSHRVDGYRGGRFR